MDADTEPDSRHLKAFRSLGSFFSRSPKARAVAATTASSLGGSVQATGHSTVNASVYLQGSLNPAEREAARALMASFIASAIGGDVIENAIDIGTTIQRILEMADAGKHMKDAGVASSPLSP